ncbi:uncharacterized protein LOC134765687 [Penaeus indicus]|uniref:uncharacterized protein LOC134765687 n=1 Tax=Penaeus indicus TaxID=29960 RepID=UPI00300CDAB7
MLPEGYSEEDFIFAKLSKGVCEVGQMAMCQLAKDIYSHPLTDADNGHMYLKTYCEMKNINLNMNFFPNMIQTDITKEIFDISAAHIIVKDVCVHFYNSLSEQCKTSIKDLVEMRNVICHRYGCKEDDMKVKLDLLKTIIRNIYEEIGKKLKKCYDCDISKAEDIIDNIINAKLQDNISDTWSDIENFKKRLRFKLICHGRNKLHVCYSKLTVLNPCTWLGEIDYKILTDDFDYTKCSKIDRFKVDKIYTTLKIADKRSNLDVKDLLITTDRKKREEYIPQILLLEGQAGCGKTSLCRFLIHEWCKTLGPHKTIAAIKDLENYDLVILVELRRTRSVTFEDFLRHDLLYDVCKDFTDEDLRYLLDDLKLLIVIDGFDERKDDNLTRDIFQTCKSKRIILSTRTKCLDDAKSLAKKEMMTFLSISICGFDYPGLKEFSEKVFHAIEDDPTKRKQELLEFQRLIDEKKHIVRARQHLADYQLPLTIAFIIILWRDNPEVINQISTSTSLYLEVFKLFQKKLKERLCKLRQIQGLNKKLDALMLLLGNIAWKMLKEGNYMLTDNLYKDIKKECKEMSVNHMELLSAFLMCETNYNSDVDDLVFMFLHKTQMEYLAAVYLYHQIKKRKETVKQIFSQAEDCQEVFVYLIGYMAMNKQLDRDIINAVVNGFVYKADDFTFWWEVYSESLYNEEIGRLIVNKQLQRKELLLNDEHIVCGLRFMSTDLTKKLTALRVDLRQDPDDIPQILEALRDIKKPERKYNTTLEFHKHYQLVNCGTSDKYLMSLISWGNLTHFVGSLGKEGCKILSNFKNLVNISAKLSEPEAINLMSCSLKKLKKVRNLRVALCLPPGCVLPPVCDLQPCDSLEVWFHNMTDKNKEWMVKEVLNKVAGMKGCKRVHLRNSDLTFNALMWIVENLQGIVMDKLMVDTALLDDKEMDNLNAKAIFNIEFL